jgi:hypothetical protein
VQTNEHLSPYWPNLSVHQDYWEHHNNPHVYTYDPADDGPEVEVIISIRINHPELGRRAA